jgi:hypothetical protein
MRYRLTLAGKVWPGWVGGYQGWIRDRPPETNAFAFYHQVEKLRHATMLEF